MPAVNEYIEQLKVDNMAAYDALLASRSKQVQASATRRNPNMTFEEGQEVVFKRRTRATGKVRKLEPIWQGPYKITAVDEATGNCTLDLPKRLKMHNIFASDKLKLYKAREGTDHTPPSPDNQELEDIDMGEDRMYEVEKILDHEERDGEDYWLIKWEGYGNESNSWEPNENVADTAVEAIFEYLTEATPAPADDGYVTDDTEWCMACHTGCSHYDYNPENLMDWSMIETDT